MKNFLVTLAGISAVSTMVSTGLISQTEVANPTILTVAEKNINQIIYQSEGNYSYNYQIYVNHNNLNHWNSLYNHEALFQLTVGYDLKTFKTNSPVTLWEAHILASDVYSVWNKDKVMSYDHNQGVIIKFEYSRYDLLSTKVSPQ